MSPSRIGRMPSRLAHVHKGQAAVPVSQMWLLGWGSAHHWLYIGFSAVS